MSSAGDKNGWDDFMHTTLNRAAGLAGLCLAASGFLATAAQALPDLVINTRDTYVQPGGCGKDEPVATGRIAIKNQGTDTAEVNVADRLTRSMLVVYVPENIDMIDKRPERAKLEPFDQQGIAFRLGDGIQKKGRNFLQPSSANYTAAAPSTTSYVGNVERVRAIQSALNSLGFDPQGVDGRLGPNTRDAISDFQTSLGGAATGTLTPAQEAKLYEKAGVSGVSGTGAQGETTVRVYVAVDPYNLVEESDESNNLWSFTVTVNCN